MANMKRGRRIISIVLVTLVVGLIGFAFQHVTMPSLANEASPITEASNHVLRPSLMSSTDHPKGAADSPKGQTNEDAALVDAINALAKEKASPSTGNVKSPLFPVQIANNAHFGYAVAIDGDTAVVGAENDLVNGQTPGVAYIFTFDGINWVQQQRLGGLNVTGADFGKSVAIDGDTVVVGSPGEGSGGSITVFTRNGSIWTEQQRILKSGGISASADHFGDSVSISGDTIIAGAPLQQGAVQVGSTGFAYIFQRSGNTWTQIARLSSGFVSANQFFGDAVAISGNYALVGYPRDSAVAQSQGSVFIYKRTNGVWSYLQTIRPSDGPVNGQFGLSVAISGGTAVVGVPYPGTGAAYVYRFDGQNWFQDTKLLAADGVPQDAFGWNVAVSGERVLVGAPGTVFTNPPGAAYLFSRNGLKWQFEEKFTAAVPVAADQFGHGVAISGNKAIMGLPNDDYAGFSNAGSAVTVLLGANAVVKMRRPNEASLTQPSIDLGLTNIDAPLVYKSDRDAIGAAPVVGKGLVADGVTPLLFDIEVAEETITGTVDTEVVVEISYGGTISGDAIEDRMLYLDNGTWSTSPLFTFTEIENRHFAYLEPIGSDEVQFDPGSNEIEVKVQILNKATSISIGTKRFYIRKPPVALIHGYNTDGTWGEDFKDELAISRPLGIGGEDFVRTIRYGQEPAGAAVNTQEATTLSFAVLANKALVEFNEMRDSIDDDWALTRYDVVAHSQGGVLSRMLTSRNANSFVAQPFRNADNFNRGRFHRVVTIGSPDRKSTRLNSSHITISYAVFCLKKKKENNKELE